MPLSSIETKKVLKQWRRKKRQNKSSGQERKQIVQAVHTTFAYAKFSLCACYSEVWPRQMVQAKEPGDVKIAERMVKRMPEIIINS